MDMVEEVLQQQGVNINDYTEITEERVNDSYLIHRTDTPLVTETNLRYRGADWFEPLTKETEPALVVGLGGLGSNLLWQLARTGIKNVIIQDYDRIDYSNLAGQLYTPHNIGEYKTEVSMGIACSLSPGVSITRYNYPFVAGNSKTHLFTFSCLDNMQTRKDVYKEWLSMINSMGFKTHRKKAVLIDARCTVDYFCIYCVTSDNPYSMELYEKEFFTDEEADEEVCSLKQTTYLASMAASTMVNLFVNYVMSWSDDTIYLPVKVEYGARTMTFTKVL